MNMANVVKLISNFFLILWSLLKEFIGKFFPEKRKNISGKLVLITEAGGGIGRQLALKFAVEKTKLALLDVNKQNCDETSRLVRSLGITCQSYLCDVSKRDEIRKVAKLIREDLGEVDVLVNNAGIANYKPILDLTEGDIRNLLDINLLAAFWTIQEFLPEMNRRNEGHIVNIASMAGCIGLPWASDYSTSKFGLRGLSESLCEELTKTKKTGIIVSIVYPSYVDTQMTRHIPDRFDLTDVKMLSPENVAEQIVDSVLRNTRHIFVPKKLWTLNAMINVLPVKTMTLIRHLNPTGARYNDTN